MNKNWKFLFTFLFLAFLILPGGACTKTKNNYVGPTNFANQYWTETFTGAGGFDGFVYSLLLNGSELYAGGNFNTAASNGAEMRGIAKWDGTNWNDMGYLNQLGAQNITIWTTLRDSSGNLYVGGSFDQIGKTAAQNIARWNASTSSWEALGGGVDGTVYALAMNSQGHLYVGGTFTTADYTNVTVNRLAKWDGSNWSAVTDGGLSNTVRALAMDSSDNLYVGGAFASTVNGFGVKRVGKLNSNGIWEQLGNGVDDSTVYTIYLSGSNVYVGGSFNAAGGAVANTIGIAMYNGTTWSAIANGLASTANTAYSIVVSGSDVYVGGNFTNAGTIADADYIVRINGATYNALDKGLNSIVWSIHLSGSNVYAGGQFTQDQNATPVPMNRVGLFNGTTWSAIGASQSNAPNDQTVYALGFDGTGKMYAGGSFTSASNVANTVRIAQYDPTAKTWSAMGSGISNNVVRAIGIDGSNIYVGGSFTNAGGNTNADGVGYWDGSAWQALGTGNDLRTTYAITVTGTNQVYIGGSFSNVGNNDGDGIVLWNGTAFSALDKGLNGTVRAILPDGNGNLYVGGSFTADGNGKLLNNLAKWNGTTSKWEDVGGGTTGTVYALALDSQNRLYVGGGFTYAGGLEVNSVGYWDGSSWHTAGRGLAGTTIYDLVFDASGRLYIGGNINGTQGLVPGMVIWDGTNFINPGSGAGLQTGNATVWDLEKNGTTLYLGGNFIVTGDKAAQRIGQWQLP